MLLFVIYFADVRKIYETNPPDDFREARRGVEIRNQKSEPAWQTQKEVYRFRRKGGKHQKEISPEQWATKIKSDTLT